jgi:MoxR-like ATPase
LNELVQHPGAETLTADEARALVTRVADSRTRVLTELRKTVIGQDESVDLVLAALFSGGHCLLTGVPGLAKTLLVRTLAQILDLGFRRIQFTPDLMPSDITGTEVLDESDGIRALRFVRGPVFTQMLLADEINRTPPKTQAALLEAMQEGHVTAAGRSYQLEPPFFVLATQNPIELEGTYPLPEAQLDRFLFNIVMTYLPEADEVRVVTETTGVRGAAPSRVLSRDDIVSIQGLVRHVVIPEEVARYAVRLSAASRPGQPGVPDFVNRYVKWGAGLRASQALVLGAKARSLMMGRAHVTVDDIRALAAPVFRHRVLVNFQAESEGLTPDAIVARLVEAVPVPASGLS